MYRQAVEWMEESGKDALAGDIFRWARCAVPAEHAVTGFYAVPACLKECCICSKRCGSGHHCRPALPARCALQAGQMAPGQDPTVGGRPRSCCTAFANYVLIPAPPAAPCRQAIGHLVKTQKWGDAVQLLMRFAASCDNAGARSSQCKAYLGAVVVWLYASNAKQAWMTYQVCGWG